MPTLTARDIIDKAFRKLEAVAAGEVLTASEANDAFDALNNMLDSWAGRSLLTTAHIRESFPLVAGQYLYTIGNSVTADFNTLKPFEIVNAFIRDTVSSLDYDVSIISSDIYNSYEDKALTGASSRPTTLFYDPGTTQQTIQLGNIYLYPVPDATTTYSLFLESEKPFTSFSSLTSVVTFPTGYKRALIYNLAIELSSDFNKPISGEVLKTAQESMRIIENINSRNKKGVVGMDFPGKQKAYNVYSDSY